VDSFFRSSQAGGRPSAGSVHMPIGELSLYSPGRWKIKARVLTKGEIRKFTNQRGEGQLFKVELKDHSGEISATFFGKAVDMFYPLLRPGQVFTFTRGHVKPGNPRWDKSTHVLTFEEQSQIEAVEEDRSIPGLQFDFKPLCDLEQAEPGTYMDVRAVIFSLQDAVTFTAKSGKEMTKREIGLWDVSGGDCGTTCDVTLWGGACVADYQVGSVVFVKGARIGEFQGAKGLSGPDHIEVDPDDAQAFALKRRYEEQQRIRPLMGKVNMRSGKRQTIEACRQEDLHLGPPRVPGMVLDPSGPRSVHRHTVAATVAAVPLDRMPCYPACTELVERGGRPNAATQGGQPEKRACQKKCVNEGGLWRCGAGHTCEQPMYRYIFRVQVLDHTDTLEVQGYDQVGKELFGCDAGEYAQVWDSQDGPEREQRLLQLRTRALWRRVTLSMQAKKEVWQEAERTNYSVEQANVLNLSKEARSMLAEVRAALAAP